MSARVMAVLLNDDLAGLVIERAAALVADAPPAALLYVAVIDAGSVAALEFIDDSVDPVVRLSEEGGMLFEEARTVARRRGIEPETTVLRAVDRDLVTALAAQAAEWKATTIVLGEPDRGRLFGRIGRTTAGALERKVFSGVRVVRVTSAD